MTLLFLARLGVGVALGILLIGLAYRLRRRGARTVRGLDHRERFPVGRWAR